MAERVHLNELFLEKLSTKVLEAVEDLEVEEDEDTLPPLPPLPFVVLRNELADVYSDLLNAMRIVEEVGVQSSRIDFKTAPINYWHAILKEVCHAGLCKRLRDVVLAEYPKHKNLRKAFKDFRCQPP
jgi:Effector-associated domain 1